MGGNSSHEEQPNTIPNAMNYLNSAQYQAMYNQVYSGATSNPLHGERFQHNEYNYHDQRNEPNQPIPIEVKKTVAVKLEMSIDKKTIELRHKEQKKWVLSFRFSCDVEIQITIYFFAMEQSNLQSGITENVMSAIDKSPMTYKFLPCQNAEFPNEKSTIYLSDDKIRDLEKEKFGMSPQERKSIYVYCKFIRENNEKLSAQVLRQKYEMNGMATVADEVYGLGASKLTENQNKEAADCIICMSDKIDVIVLPCNHMCLCYACCVDFRSKNKKCPICRTPIDSFVKMEVSNPQNRPPNQQQFYTNQQPQVKPQYQQQY